ncbi:MAG: hypothetical protein ACYS29_03090 [Planctomycetota bacterium]|jgi:4-amino-4-deoxy-L-arabinose transferase-like glycosyltransferase
MVRCDNADSFVKKQDLIHIMILLAVATAIGVYLIATTVLIAKDGVLYIKQAQKFAVDPMSVVKHDFPFGYPFLIFAAHELAAVFGDSASMHLWVHSAQGANLIFRILSLIPLYLIARMLVGSRNSFWAILILVLLPYPAKLGSDALRDWPHIFFLAAGFCAILYGGLNGCSWFFGIAGLSCGLGYVIRPECAQLVAYGLLWSGYRLLRPTQTVSRAKAVRAVLLLLLGFLIPVAPYTTAKGSVLPRKVRVLMNAAASNYQHNENEEQNPPPVGPLPKKYVAGPSKLIVNSLYQICKDIGEDLMWIFVLPWLIGIFYLLRTLRPNKGKFLMSVFIAANAVLLLLRCTHFDQAMTKRYVLPLIALTICYVPTGLEILGRKIAARAKSSVPSDRQWQKWFYVLLIGGLCFCMPKLFRPIGGDKRDYRKVAQWLNENTAKDAVIAVRDGRLSFYAQRKGLGYGEKMPAQATYAVEVHRDTEESLAKRRMSGAKPVFSVDDHNKRRAVVVLDLRHCISETVSFVDYRYLKAPDEGYEFSFLFKVHKRFEEDFTIFLHGRPREEDVTLLPRRRQRHKFDNWDFYPRPATSTWPANEVVTITRTIPAKPIPYKLSLGFYTPKDRRHGRRINLGWVDLGSSHEREAR